jgi:hypothetical protein
LKISFLFSLFVHAALIALLFSEADALLYSSDKTPAAVKVNLVASLPKQSPEKLTPSPAKKTAKKEQHATTKLAPFNPAQTPTKQNKQKPQTLIPPSPSPSPSPKISKPSPPSPPQKNTSKAKATPPPTQKTQSQPSQTKPKKKPNPKNKKQQPEAAPPEKPTKKNLTLESVLKSLNEHDNTAITSRKTQKQSSTKPQKKSSPSQPSSHASEKPRLNPSDLIRLKNQLSSCWTILSTENAINHTVKVRIRFDDNFRVTHIELPEEKEKGHQTGYRVAADQARSAIMHPACQPLDLPKNKISSSDALLLNFNPQAMMGNLPQ